MIPGSRTIIEILARPLCILPLSSNIQHPSQCYPRQQHCINRSLRSRPQTYAPAMDEPLRIPKSIREMEVGNMFPRHKRGGRRDDAIKKGSALSSPRSTRFMTFQVSFISENVLSS